MTKLTKYLKKYFDMQEQIMLVYHPTEKSTWSDRCLFMGPGYDVIKEYNHRSILNNEIVIEYDFDTKERNHELIKQVEKRLKADGIKYSTWFTGGKSIHLHFFVDTKNASNITLLKKSIIRHYTEGMPLPDIVLTAPNHLIRAEYGVHEKTQYKKLPITEVKGYPCLNTVVEPIWGRYVRMQEALIRRKVTIDLRDVESLPGFQFILNTHQFREHEDGRERALFILIHLLKQKYSDKNEFIKFCQQWYRYSGGRKLSEEDIRRKVTYHWSRTYNIGETYLYEFLESIGREDLVPKEIQ